MRYYNFALYASAEQIRENTTINLPVLINVGFSNWRNTVSPI